MVSFTNHRQLSKTGFTEFDKIETIGNKVTKSLDEETFLKDFIREGKRWSINGTKLDGIITFPNLSELPAKLSLQPCVVKARQQMFDKLFGERDAVSQVSPDKRRCYENFLKLFLNQNWLNTNPNVAQQSVAHASKGKLILTEVTKEVDIALHEQEVYITVRFTASEIDKVTGIEVTPLAQVDPETDFLVRGEAIYKIEMLPRSQKAEEQGWIAKYGLVSSNIECKEQYREMLDTRSLFQKILDFLEGILNKVTTDINSKEFLASKPKMKSIALFFQSTKDGKAVEKIGVGKPPEPSMTPEEEKQWKEAGREQDLSSDEPDPTMEERRPRLGRGGIYSN